MNEYDQPQLTCTITLHKYLNAREKIREILGGDKKN